MILIGIAVVAAVAVLVLLMPRASIKIAREYQRVVLVPIRQQLEEDDHGAR